MASRIWSQRYTKHDHRLISTYISTLVSSRTFLLLGGIKLELLDNNEKPLFDLTPDYVLTSEDDKFVST